MHPVLLGLGLLIAGFLLMVFATAFENSSIRISRKQFALWLIIIIVGVPLASMLIGVIFALLQVFAGPMHQLTLGATVTLGLVMSWLFQQALVRRARDAGWGKALCYVAIIPLLNIPVWVYFLFATPDTASTLDLSRMSA